MDNNEETKYLCIYDDCSIENSRHCVEDINGNFIVYDNTIDGTMRMDMFDHLPEEFKNCIYFDINECVNPRLAVLGNCVVNYIDFLSSTEDVNEFKRNIAYEFGRIKALTDNGWEIESVDITQIKLRTQLVYVSREEMEGSEISIAEE